jgi:tetratricopeptide (TPR) repeat protein
MADMEEALGLYYKDVGDHERGLSYLKRAVKYYTLTGNNKALKRSLRLYAGSLLERDSAEQALHYAKEALRLAQIQQSDVGEVQALILLSNIYLKREDWDKVKSMVDQAFLITGKLQFYQEFFEVSLYNNRAKLAQKEGEWNKAGIAYRKAHALAVATGNTSMHASIAKALGQVEHDLGNSAAASQWYETYIQLQDSLVRAEREDEIRRLLVGFDVERIVSEKKQLEIETHLKEEKLTQQRLLFFALGLLLVLLIVLLWLWARQQRLRNKQQITELKQEALRAQMNPHFVFNAMGSIQQFFLQNDLAKGANYLQTFGQLMRDVLDQSSRKLISLQEEVQTLERYTSLEQARMGEALEVYIQVDESLHAAFVQIPPLIVQPFVENAIVDGIRPRAEGGRVSISFTKQEKALVCIVDDNGVGMNQDEKKPEHQSKGMKIPMHRLRLSAAGAARPVRIEHKHNERGEPSGTRVLISFPLIYKKRSE